MGTSANSEPSAEEVRDYLAVGLRNRWYPVFPSRLVQSDPVALYRLGERLVLWRDHAGQVHLQEDRCPHRAAPLSKGANCGDRLRCTYHGVEIGPDGTILAVPGEPGCPLVGQKLVKTLPTFELKGAVFAWFGDALHREPGAYVPPAQLQEDEHDAFLCYAEWAASWRIAYDNNMDPMHGTFLHAKSHSMNRGDATAAFRTRSTDSGFIFEKTGQHDVNFDWSEFCDTGAIYVRLEIPYPPSGGPGGNFGIIFHATPIDAGNMAGFFWRFRKVTGWQRDAWRFLYKNRLEARHWHVLEQDRVLLEAMEPGAELNEHLYTHDVGVSRMRRWIEDEARAQLRQLRGSRL